MVSAFFLKGYSGKPDLIKVMIVKKPNTATVPNEKINPKTFLFFNAPIKAKIPRIATKPNMIAVPIYENLLPISNKELNKTMYEKIRLSHIL